MICTGEDVKRDDFTCTKQDVFDNIDSLIRDLDDPISSGEVVSRLDVIESMVNALAVVGAPPGYSEAQWQRAGR